jgi:hypothetical protein
MKRSLSYFYDMLREDWIYFIATGLAAITFSFNSAIYAGERIDKAKQTVGRAWGKFENFGRKISDPRGKSVQESLGKFNKQTVNNLQGQRTTHEERLKGAKAVGNFIGNNTGLRGIGRGAEALENSLQKSGFWEEREKREKEGHQKILRLNPFRRK